MKTAFLILKSPLEQDPTHVMKRFASPEEASVILVEDGVFQALSPDAAVRLGKAAHEILVSRQDVEARGFDPSKLKAGRAVGYDEIVDLIMERTERTVTV
jgi:sulfur relay protein TusB/DsrH